MSEDHNRLLAELQGAASEVLGLRIAGKASEEAEAQLEATMRRVEEAEKYYRLQSDRLRSAVTVVRYALEARDAAEVWRRSADAYAVSVRDWAAASRTPVEAFGEGVVWTEEQKAAMLARQEAPDA